MDARDRTLDRLLGWADDLAHAAASELSGPAQADVVARIDSEYANISAALDWSLSGGDISRGVAVAEHLGLYWEFANRAGEGRRFFREALKIVSNATDEASALICAARLGLVQGDFDDTIDLATEALRLTSDDGADPTEALTLIGTAWVRKGDAENARTYFTDALAAARVSEVDRAIDVALNNLGTLSMQIGDAEAASSYLEQSLELVQRRGDRQAEATTLINLGGLSITMGRPVEAVAHLTAARSALDGLGSRRTEAMVLIQLGNAHYAVADFEEAGAAWAEALIAAGDAGDQGLVAVASCGLAMVAASTGARNAAPLLRDARRMASTLGMLDVVASADLGLAQVRLAEGAGAEAARLAAASAAVMAPIHLRQAIAGVDVVAAGLALSEQWPAATRVMAAADRALESAGYDRNAQMDAEWSSLWLRVIAAGERKPSSAEPAEDLVAVLLQIADG